MVPGPEIFGIMMERSALVNHLAFKVTTLDVSPLKALLPSLPLPELTLQPSHGRMSSGQNLNRVCPLLPWVPP